MPNQNKTKALTPVDAFKKSIQETIPKFKDILPRHVSPEKFQKVLLTVATVNPELANADRRLLWNEITMCAQDGLLPDGREATIYAFGKKPKYIPMVAGICKKARNSGLIQTIDAQVVYENDTYESWIDEKGPHFKFARAKGDRGKVLLTFAYAITKDEGFFHEEIDEKQMQAIEKSSKAKDGPWKGPFKDEMRRKSAIRRLAKYRLPSSSDLEEVFKREDDLYDLDKGGGNGSTPPKPKAEGPSRLKGIIDTEPLDPETTSTTAEPAPSQPASQEPPQETETDEPPI